VIEQKSAEAIVVACEENTKRRAERLDEARLIMLGHCVTAVKAGVMTGVERRTGFE